jgi:hypothetical protein
MHVEIITINCLRMAQHKQQTDIIRQHLALETGMIAMELF